MCRQIQIQLLIRGSDHQRIKRNVMLNVEEGDNIQSLKQKLGESTGMDADNFNFIFCGKQLPVDLILDRLQLGQSTSLVATVSAEPIRSNFVIVSPAIIEDNQNQDNGSYFVYCKSCTSLKPGKLRMYCSTCNSNAVLLYAEPNDWSDIFDAGPLMAQCQDCEAERRVKVVFKCKDCDEISAALRHVKRNRYDRDCIVCDDIAPQIVVLSCSHATCVDCFTAYLENSLEEWTFFRRPVGFTIGCPMFGCNAAVEDVHHFHFMGIEKYKKYQHQAAERFLSVLEERQYCPFPDCGAAFTIELINDEKLISCPECSHLYCIDCKSTDKCHCHDSTIDESVTVIKSISKPCPACAVPTERNGGCAHISCTQCRTDWCFICSKEWTTDCQWDHWFD